MKLLVVSHYYPPEVGAPQARLGEMAAMWQGWGADTTVLTGMPNHPTGVVHAAYRGAVVRSERIDGVRVLRTWVYATPNERFLKKTLCHLSFMVTSVVLGGVRTGPVDVVLVSSPTFFSIMSAWVIARLRRAAFVIEVRDLWPGVFVELGILSNRLLIGLLERVELGAYSAADHVVVVTEGFRANLVKRGVPREKVSLIPNGVDVRRFATRAPTSSLEPIRAWLGANPDDTLVLYLGAHGMSQGLSSVVNAANLLVGHSIHFAFVGEGADKRRLEAHCRELGLTNVTMLPAVPRDRAASVIAAADICLVPLRDIPMFSTFIPSKMFEFLGARRAVIGSVRGESARILEDSGACVVPPEDADAIAEAIRQLAADPERRSRMGEQGLAYVSANFDRSTLARRYLKLLFRLAGRKGVS